MSVELVIRRFDELSLKELYEILRLRSEVFVLEQNCVYQDLDGKDFGAYHVFLRDGAKIQAYLRVLDKGVSFAEGASIGRVVARERRKGYAGRLIDCAIQIVRERFHAQKIVIEAQTYARSLYEKHGFVQSSGEFLEDGIPHIQMTLDILE